MVYRDAGSLGASDVKFCNPLAKTLPDLSKYQENLEKTSTSNAFWSNSCVPLISCTGGAAHKATKVMQRLAEKIGEKYCNQMPTTTVTSEPK